MTSRAQPTRAQPTKAPATGTHATGTVDRETVATVIVFAPTDADSRYLEMQPELASLGEDDDLGEVEILEVFEGMEVPNSDRVVDPERSSELRERYAVEPGGVTVLVLSPGDQQPVIRLDRAVDGRALREAIGRARAAR